MNSIANELIVRGWATGIGKDEFGRVCLWAALGFACKWDPEMLLAGKPGRNAVEQAITDVTGCSWDGDIPMFNDHSDDYDTVLRVAKHADELLGL